MLEKSLSEWLVAVFESDSPRKIEWNRTDDASGAGVPAPMSTHSKGISMRLLSDSLRSLGNKSQSRGEEAS